MCPIWTLGKSNTLPCVPSGHTAKFPRHPIYSIPLPAIYLSLTPSRTLSLPYFSPSLTSLPLSLHGQPDRRVPPAAAGATSGSGGAAGSSPTGNDTGGSGPVARRRQGAQRGDGKARSGLLRRRAAGSGPGGGVTGGSSPVAGGSVPMGGGAADLDLWRQIQPDGKATTSFPPSTAMASGGAGDTASPREQQRRRGSGLPSMAHGRRNGGAAGAAAGWRRTWWLFLYIPKFLP